MSRRTYKEVAILNLEWLILNHHYTFTRYDKFSYSVLKYTHFYYKRKMQESFNLSDCIIMFDTETSKKSPNKKNNKGIIPVENHVVAWTISIRVYSMNICTLWGTRPSEFIECVKMILSNLNGNLFYFYAHNLSYDWTFLQKFLIKEFGKPIYQLNTKSHYPICIEFKNGLTLKDSLILAQRSLDKWSADLDVVHKKSVGKWDYDKIRNQGEQLTSDELDYIEHDTLAGVECIDATLKSLGKTLANIPFTATGIPREQVKEIGQPNNAKQLFNKTALTYSQYLTMSRFVYHGGYTHSNRHLVDFKLDAAVLGENIIAKDFASSYPYALLCKLPMGAFAETEADAEDIIKLKDDYAFFFKAIFIQPCINSPAVVMPAMQQSKCTRLINAIIDNGRILSADYIEIYLTELDLDILLKQYKYLSLSITDCHYTVKDYLPRWFTDYVYKCFYDKTMLKGGDPVQYSISKALLNSLYGMCVQKYLRDEIIEDYDTGEFNIENNINEEEYEKYIKARGHILPYQWGTWVTAIAMNRLFQLGECCSQWIYSDTDSIYGIGWDDEKLNKFNEDTKQFLVDRGYPVIEKDGRMYWLGVAETDGIYSEFKVEGAKRYCCRSADSGKLKITVAGVPKRGVECLNNNIDNFKAGLIFNAEITHKLTHTYITVEDIYIDKNGNETGDSVDLNPCDYLLDSIFINDDWEELFQDEYEMQQLTMESDYDMTIRRI